MESLYRQSSNSSSRLLLPSFSSKLLSLLGSDGSFSSSILRLWLKFSSDSSLGRFLGVSLREKINLKLVKIKKKYIYGVFLVFLGAFVADVEGKEAAADGVDLADVSPTSNTSNKSSDITLFIYFR